MRTNVKDVRSLWEVGILDFDLKSNDCFETMLCKKIWFLSRKLLGSCSELDTELVTIKNEIEEALNDTTCIAENDGFVAPNYDYVITLAPKTTIEDMDGDNFINARIRPLYNIDQVYSDLWLVPVPRIFHLINLWTWQFCWRL